MTEERSPFVCASCGTFTAELHCGQRDCDWLVCGACESIISDVDHRTIASRERYLRELYDPRRTHPSAGA